MEEKNAPQGTAFPDAMQNKKVQKNYSKDLRKRKEHYFRKYRYLVLLLLCINNVGFWIGCFAEELMLWR